jgi:hypothetical protein
LFSAKQPMLAQPRIVLTFFANLGFCSKFQLRYFEKLQFFGPLHWPSGLWPTKLFFGISIYCLNGKQKLG